MDSSPASNTQVGYTGLVNKACKRDLTKSTVIKIYLDDALSDGPVERTVGYKASFFKPSKEEEYRKAWGVFANSETEK